MILTSIIKYENELNTILKLQKVVYTMLTKFKLTCPKKYNKVLEPLQKTPICIFINYKFSEVVAAVSWTGNRKIKQINIEFNHLIFECNNKQTKAIISHELGHVIDLLYRGSKSPDHDKVWKEIAVIFGALPNSTIPRDFLP